VQLERVYVRLSTPLRLVSLWSSTPPQRQAALNKEKAELGTVQAKVAEAEKALRDAEKGREDSVSDPLHKMKQAHEIIQNAQQKRRDLLARLASARRTHEALKAELQAHGAADPVKFAEKKRAVESAKEASLRWTGECNMLSGRSKKGPLIIFSPGERRQHHDPLQDGQRHHGSRCC
jgi:phage-related minor tail protein